MGINDLCELLKVDWLADEEVHTRIRSPLNVLFFRVARAAADEWI